MKKLFLPIIAIAVFFTACLENDSAVPPALIMEIEAPVRLQPNTVADITATMVTSTPGNVTSVVVEWSLGGVSQPNINMTGAGATWTAQITGQEEGSRVSFRVMATVTGENDPLVSETQSIVWPDSLAGQLLIFQAFGTGSEVGRAVNRSFVELYNTTSAPINLEGITLFWADGIRGPGVTADEDWNMIPLVGTIPANGSFLITGPDRGTEGGGTLVLNEGDMYITEMEMSNRAFKVALIRGTTPLTAQNPFTMDAEGIATGYIDMVGAANNLTGGNPDNIFGFETVPTRNSRSESVRRSSLIDTDNNLDDFVGIRFAEDAGARTTLFPRSSAAGSWTPTF